MGKIFGKKIWRVISAVGVPLLAIVVSFTVWATGYRSLISGYIGGETSKVIKGDDDEEIDTEYYKDNGMDLDDWIAYEEELSRDVQAAGTVLLKNENNLLPLKEGSKVSTFGYGTIYSVSTGLVQYGTAGEYVSFYDGMTEDGKLEINPTLYSYYQTNSTGTLAFNTINEVDVSNLSSTVRSSYSDYSDAAIVVISRAGGEAGDLDTTGFDDNGGYLELQDVEKKMLEEVTEHFEHVIVLINSSYAMELGWLDDYDIDAALMIGAIGYLGFNAVSDILVGRTNPSGKLADTWAANSFSSPAMQNFGDYEYTNASSIESQIGSSNNATNYVVELEGIYVGYKYYETRYEDTVMGQGNADSTAGVYESTSGWNYSEEVLYSFGYGLSYTTYTQEITNVKETDDTFEVTVKVTNTGSVSGRSVVQIYAQTPYTDYDEEMGIEVSSVELVGFGKTEELASGADTTVTISVDKSDLTHYDSYGWETYIMEEGWYYLAVGDSAHDALNNILALKGYTTDDGMDYNGDSSKVYRYYLSDTDTDTYAYTSGGVKITNQFDDVDLNYWLEDEVTYLSRSDWEATWPETVVTLTASADMIEAMDAEGNYEAGDSDLSEYTFEADTDYAVAMMIGEDFDSEGWELILNQMSIEDLATLVTQSGLNVVESISYPSVYMKDGSHRVTDRTYVGTSTYAVIMPSAVIMAQSFDRDLLYEIGTAYGEDNIRTETAGHYAPGVNIHRTPYSGRNFEYYSEDSYLSGELAVPIIQGMQEKGAITFIKHLLGNEQETNRNGVCTFMTQQAVRELYLDAFEAGLVEGQSKGVMGGFNRIGCTWTGAHEGLMTNVLRGEFEWTGIIDTDAVFSYSSYMGFKAGLMAGTTMWATSGTYVYSAVIDEIKTDAQLVGKMREAAHYLLYNVVNSLAFNGIGSNDKVVAVTPYWEVILDVIISVVSVATAISLVMVGVDTVKGKKAKKKEEN